jgi:hypothetical protein
MKVLNLAAKAAHIAKLAQKEGVQRYSQFPVHEAEFWNTLFKYAKSAKTAQKVLDEILIIDEEPCIDNERVFLNVQTARRLAMIALLN